jgi:hypothetical protein
MNIINFKNYQDNAPSWTLTFYLYKAEQQVI